MNLHRSSRSIGLLTAVAVAVIAALAIIAGGVLGSPGAAPRPSSPAQPPSAPVPSLTPSGAPIIDQPPAGPIDDSGDGIDVVELINLPGVDSSVAVWDETDNLADALSGSPDRDGPVARNVIEAAGSADGSTVRLIWSDLPVASRAMLSIRHTNDGKYLFTLFRPTEPGPTDNVVSDRVLDLKFHVSIPIDQVEVKLVEGLAPSAGVGLVQGGVTDSGGAGLSIAVWDETDGLIAAPIDQTYGDPQVGPNRVVVTNEDTDTLRLTWADPEVATYAKISIRIDESGRYQLRFVREQPQGPTLPLAQQRSVLLEFVAALPAEDVDVEFIDAMSNDG